MKFKRWHRHQWLPWTNERPSGRGSSNEYQWRQCSVCGRRKMAFQ